NEGIRALVHGCPDLSSIDIRCVASSAPGRRQLPLLPLGPPPNKCPSAFSDTGHTIPNAFTGGGGPFATTKAQDLRRYFAALAHGSLVNAFVKNVLMGRGKAGKTSLCRTMDKLLAVAQRVAAAAVAARPLPSPPPCLCCRRHRT
ncbi:MAG: hypothetical protein AAFS07_19235, partial [Pseudomonadota bacterium]